MEYKHGKHDEYFSDSGYWVQWWNIVPVIEGEEMSKKPGIYISLNDQKNVVQEQKHFPFNKSDKAKKLFDDFVERVKQRDRENIG